MMDPVLMFLFGLVTGLLLTLVGLIALVLAVRYRATHWAEFAARQQQPRPGPPPPHPSAAPGPGIL